MRTYIDSVRERALARSARMGRFGRRLARDEDGVTALEFAMVGFPFFMLLFGIMGTGLYFFSIFNLENAVEQASRPLRTGEAQKAGMTKDQFKTSICNQVAAFFDCAAKMRVQVVNVTAAQALNPLALPALGTCREKLTPTGPDVLVAAANTKFDVTAATQTVVVTVCYQMDMLQSLPFISLGNMPDGSTMIQASTAFKTEPF
jgi:Flp pilus assembly protein TadG